MIEINEEGNDSIESFSDTPSADGLPHMHESTQESRPHAFIDPSEQCPDTYFYRKETPRPRISDLQEKAKRSKIKEAPPVDKKKNRGTFAGVFLPIIVNMMGTIFWNRVGKLVGNVGIVYSIVIVWCAALISFLVITSLTAMATNGELGDGGVYFIVSRTIGPEVGRCIAFFLVLAHCFSAASAMLGFAETVVAMYQPNYFTGSSINDIRVIAYCVYVVTLFLTNFVQQLRLVTFITDIIGMISFILGVFIRKPGSVGGFLGASTETFISNTHDSMSFAKFVDNMALVTPGFTSILGCFIFSGTIKRPEKMVPKGLILSWGIMIVIWHVTVLLLGACGDRTYLSNSLLSPLVSFGIIKWIGFTSIVVFTGHRSVHSTAVPRNIIKNLANDSLIPEIKFHYNIIVPSIITACAVAFGELDIVVKINTVFFMTLHAILNFMMFLAGVSHIPSWRPTSPIYHPYVSLVGSILCVTVQFSMNWIVALSAWVVVSILMIVSFIKKSNNNWGSIVQSTTYYNALRDALSLQRVQKNPKLFRVNLLTIVAEDSCFEEDLLPFIDLVLSNEGFCIVSQVINESLGLNLAIEHRNHFQQNLSLKHNMFYETVLAVGPREALAKQMLLSGLGSLRPNTLCIDIDNRPPEDILNMTLDVIESESYGLILVTRPSQIIESDTVDVWWLSDDGGLTLLVAFMSAHSSKRRLRVMSVVNLDAGDTIEETYKRMENLLTRFRIDAEIICVDISEHNSTPSRFALATWESIAHNNSLNDSFRRFLLLSDVIREYSSGASLVLSTLLIPELNMDAVTYVDLLTVISNISPTFAFVRGTGENVLSWQL